MLLLAILTAGQDRKTFTVGNATAARGQKVTGTIEVPPGVDAGLSIPVAVIHGAKPGPVLALASLHRGLARHPPCRLVLQVRGWLGPTFASRGST